MTGGHRHNASDERFGWNSPQVGFSVTDQKDIGSKDELVVPVTRPSEPQIIEEPVEPEVMPHPVPVAESGKDAAAARAVSSTHLTLPTVPLAFLAVLTLK